MQKETRQIEKKYLKFDAPVLEQVLIHLLRFLS